MTGPSNETKDVLGRECLRLKAFLTYNRYDSLFELTLNRVSGPRSPLSSKVGYSFMYQQGWYREI